MDPCEELVKAMDPISYLYKMCIQFEWVHRAPPQVPRQQSLS